MHCESGGALALQAEADAFGQAFYDFIETVGTGQTTALQTYIASSTSVNTIKWIDWSVLDGAGVQATLPGPIIGGGGSTMPGQLSIVTSWRTGFTGRSKRGRTYLPGLASTGIMTSGRISLSVTQQVKIASDLFIAALAAVNLPLVVYSRVLPGSFTPVTTSIVDDRFDVQRSRGQ